jgi:hypothetical protein
MAAAPKASVWHVTHEHEQASEEFTCNATNGVLVAPLQHGASYHVVLLATNGAGLSTRTVSRSFVVDSFSNIEVRRSWLSAYLYLDKHLPTKINNLLHITGELCALA